jgi:hypothetical protein
VTSSLGAFNIDSDAKSNLLWWKNYLSSLHLHLTVMGEVKSGGLFEYPYQSSGGLEEF